VKKREEKKHKAGRLGSHKARKLDGWEAGRLGSQDAGMPAANLTFHASKPSSFPALKLSGYWSLGAGCMQAGI